MLNKNYIFPMLIVLTRFFLLLSSYSKKDTNHKNKAEVQNIIHDEVEREYIIHFPKSYSSIHPVTLVLNLVIIILSCFSNDGNNRAINIWKVNKRNKMRLLISCIPLIKINFYEKAPYCFGHFSVSSQLPIL